MALHSIELCAGVGMLGEGARSAFEFLGHEHRTICYVEREAAAAAQLVCLMEAGALDLAPIWSDLLTFDGAAWRGCVDLLIAGFPCQDISIAGRRAGLDGKRSGLFFNILDIADACGAWSMLLENVSAIATATASAVDEAEGEIEERAAARVLGELADRGWNAEWITLSASDVGASHGRARWFCLAWRHLANTGRECGERWRKSEHMVRPKGAGEGHSEERQWDGYASDHCGSVDDAQHVELTGQRVHPGSGPAWDGAPDVDGASPAVAHPTGDGRHQGRTEPGGQQGRSDVAERGGAVADACQPGLPHAEHAEPAGSWPGHEGRAAAELCAAPLFAPGPADPIWRHLIGAGRIGAWERAVTDDEAGACPWAPATKPGVRMLADGMAIVVDESRAHQLRQAGNGVVPLQAAVALVELVRRAARH